MDANEQPDFREMFARQVRLPASELELDRAALCLAGEEYPELDIAHYLERLDALAQEVRDEIGNTQEQEPISKALNFVLFDRIGFTGNPDDYYNSENSFLHRVLDTRVGIPITLSVLYLEVARRLGLKCYGVGMPGHFLVALEELDLYLDAFHSGRLLSAGDCRRLVQEMFGASLNWSDDYLAPCGNYSIITRMLTNLKLIYIRDRNYRRGIGVLERITMIDPTAASLYKELAWCQIRLKDYRAAIQSLETYLRQADAPGDSAQVAEQIKSLWTAISRLN